MISRATSVDGLNMLQYASYVSHCYVLPDPPANAILTIFVELMLEASVQMLFQMNLLC